MVGNAFNACPCLHLASDGSLANIPAVFYESLVQSGFLVWDLSAVDAPQGSSTHLEMAKTEVVLDESC